MARYGRLALTTKPPAGSVLDQAHPLAKELVCDFSFLERLGARTWDSKNRYVAALTGASDNVLRHPLGLDFPSGGTGYVIEGAENLLGFLGGISRIPVSNFAGPITLLWKGNVATGSAYRHFAGYHLTNGATNNVFDFRTDNAATPKMVLTRTATGGARVFTGNAVSLATIASYGCTVNSNLVQTVPIFYINGVPHTPTASGTATGAVTSDASASLRIGRRADNAVQMEGQCEFFRAWKRPLTRDEMEWLHAEPYAFYRIAPSRAHYIFGAIDTGAQLVNVGDQFLFYDGIAVIKTPDEVQIAINSLNANNFDAAVIGLGLVFSDDANNLSDERQVALGTALAYDSMFYGLADAASTQFVGVLLATAADTLTLSDAASVVLFSSQSPGDSFSLSDSVALRFNYNPTFSDTLSLSDGINVILGLRTSASDSINNLSDAVVTAFTVGQTVSASDTMNNVSDAASTLLNTTLTNYLRRYLNDVVN